jgi:hyaluronan synthase
VPAAPLPPPEANDSSIPTPLPNSQSLTITSDAPTQRLGVVQPTRTTESIWYRSSLIFLAGLVVASIVVVKSTAIHSDNATTAFLCYSVLVTSFALSRLVAAKFHNRTMDYAYAVDPAYAPSVTFVIPCMNEQDAIANTVTKCFEAHYAPEKLQVIVINDGSTDGTSAVLGQMQKRFPQLVVVNWETNRGKRHGMAEGFRLARGEIIIQLDSDSYIEPSNIHALIQPFANPEIGAVCAHADPANSDENLLTRMQAAYYFLSFRILKAAESSFMAVFCCSGCSSAYRKDVVLPILDQWLNESFLGRPVTWGDDRALTNWVLRLGKKTMYTDRAQAYTICPSNFRTLLKQQVRWKKGWMVNSLFASRFVLKKYPYVALTYFYPLILLTIATPFMAARALLWMPIMHGVLPIYYALGTLSVSAVVTIYFRYVRRDNKYWPYVFVWSAINMVVLSFVLFYAVVSIQNRRWGTR